MAMWNGDNNIPDDTLYEDFPDQCFPDIDEMSINLTSQAIAVCGEDSDWSLQSDIALAAGPGCMYFFISDAVVAESTVTEGKKTWTAAEVAQHILPETEFIRVIKRGEPWEFSLTMRNGDIVKMYAPVTGMSWKPADE